MPKLVREKDAVIVIRVSVKEKKLLQRLAVVSGLGMSGWIRQRIKVAAPMVERRKEKPEKPKQGIELAE